MKKTNVSLRANQRAQTAVEYMILLGAITAVILVSFNTLVPKSRELTEGFYNKAANSILGAPPVADPQFNDYP